MLLSLKNSSIACTPLAGVCLSNNIWTIGEPKPSIKLEIKSSVPIGWVRFGIKTVEPMMFMVSCFSSTANEAIRKVLISSEGKKLTSLPFEIPPATTQLQLSPVASDGSFEIEDIIIEPISSLQRVTDVAKRYTSSPKVFIRKCRRAVAILKQGGWRALRARIFSESVHETYKGWVTSFDALTEKHREFAQKDIATWENTPLISIVVPVYNPPLDFLQKAINSVKAQYYQYWELCLCDDASPNSEVRSLIEREANNDSRIKFVFREKNGHISRASNDALSIATGEWVGLLDHDDELTADALYRVVKHIRDFPKAQMLFSDEDFLDQNGERVRPVFKSDFNPDLMLSQNAVTHFLVAKRSLINQVSGFREEVVGSQDWDLALRLSEQLSFSEIVHIPEILYHWRMHDASTATSTDAKEYVKEAQLRVIRDHLARTKSKGVVTLMQEIPHTRVHFPLPSPAPRVSILIPTRDQQKILSVCINSIVKKTSYPNYEIIVLDNGSVEPQTLEYFKTFDGNKIRVERIDIPFNFSRINNLGVPKANGELILFLNNDIEVTDGEWLSEMVSQKMRPGVGVVGARLYYPNGTLQHGGVVFGIGGIAGHSHKGRWRGDPGNWGKIALPSTFSAVTGACLLTSKKLFEEVGGFNEKDLPIQFNDLDLCLKIGATGQRCVYTPFAELIHHESLSRGYEVRPQDRARDESERAYMKKTWGKILENDPYYNPNLSNLIEDSSLAYPPRRSWKIL
jgi:glycosyltransferase involved in cell wall biosynthesis